MSRKFMPRNNIRISITCFVDFIGEGFIGTGMVQAFSGDGWLITAHLISTSPSRHEPHLRVTLPNQDTPIKVEGATVQRV